MTKVLRWGGTAGLLVLITVFPAQAQITDIAASGADQVWRGTAAGSNAGLRLDHGALSPGDNRRDLVVGAPGSAGIAGKVHVLFAGPVSSGEHSLAEANVTITGPGAGDGFGSGLAIGPVTVHRTSMTSNLVVGAPGALGGRGAVYVFATPMETAAMTAANALFTIEGAPGDRLGAALATADINNDGYREVVIGAPGNNRIYIISGASTLIGTRNLGITGGDLVINGAGIGDSIQAGDVTGDGIFEIVIGAPTQGAVYLLTGGYPAVSNLPADADAIFSGVDAGDAAGASLRIADLDADGRRDIIIGAPGGDGPDNTRNNAGEVYVLWGRPAFSSMSLAAADVTFYGAGPGYFLGEGLSAGDINRDIENDLLMHAPGASGGGDVYVYYGRSRSTFGASRGDGRQVVDFASTAASRRIVGDPASGSIAASQVYEVTGEGARDIVVGVPADSSNQGVLYFTISPKVLANPASITLTLQQGTETGRGVVLENRSTIPISWTASSNRSWLGPWPTSGTSSEGNQASITLYISAVGLSVGTHTGAVTFASTSEHLEMSTQLTVTLTVTEPPPPPPPSQAPKNDFNGDGKMDLLLRHMTDGRIETWAMNGTTRLSTQATDPGQVEPFWKIVGTGDLNADGHPDIVWQEQTAGHLYVWFMNGNNRVGHGTFSTPRVSDLGWKIVGVADLNNDGKPDLIWREENQGWLAAWLLNGTTISSVVNLNPYIVETDWEIVGNGDFNGDGKTDLIWRHRGAGWLAAWYMDGVNRIGAPYLSPNKVPDLNWDVVATGDINSDGKSDLILQHRTDGSLIAWLMDGINRTASVALTTPAANWRVVGPK